MITISLDQIREHGPCGEGWENLLKHFGKIRADDELFPFKTIIDSNGLDDAIWALRCLKDQTPSKLFVVACAQEMLSLMEDERSVNAIKIAHLFAHGEATYSDFVAARAAAWASVWDAESNAESNVARVAAGAAMLVNEWEDAWEDARAVQRDWLLAIVENY